MWFWIVLVLISGTAFATGDDGPSSDREVFIAWRQHQVRIVYTAYKSQSGYEGRRVCLGEPALVNFTTKILNNEVTCDDLHNPNTRTQVGLLSSAYMTHLLNGRQQRLSFSKAVFLDQWLSKDAQIVINLQKQILSQRLTETREEESLGRRQSE